MISGESNVVIQVDQSLLYMQNMIKLIHHCRMNDCSNNPIPSTPARAEVYFSVLSIWISNHPLIFILHFPYQSANFTKSSLSGLIYTIADFRDFQFTNFIVFSIGSPLIVRSVASPIRKQYGV